MEHKYEKEIICPYCDYQHRDSWEYRDGDDAVCNKCNKEFYVERHIECTYSTKQIEPPKTK